MRYRVCIECGKRFVLRDTHPGQKFCGGRCRNRHGRRRRRRELFELLDMLGAFPLGDRVWMFCRHPDDHGKCPVSLEEGNCACSCHVVEAVA